MSDTRQAPFNKALVDKFVIVLNLPPALKTINRKFADDNKTISLDSLQFSVFGTLTPEILVPAVETRYSGSNIYVSSHSRPSFPAIPIKFTVDNEFSNYWTIYQWLNLMRDEKEGGVGGIINARELINKDVFLREYASTFNVIAKDEFNNNIIQFNYINAFPTKLGSIDWNYQDGKEIQCSFEFVFSNITCTRV